MFSLSEFECQLTPWGTTALCAFVRVRSLDGNNLGEVGGQAIGAGLAHTLNLMGLS